MFFPEPIAGGIKIRGAAIGMHRQRIATTGDELA
jgi:hypothetical protein